MVQVHVVENPITSICEVKFTTENGNYTIWVDKIDVTQRIAEEMKVHGF